jgi:hypothetical protein
MGGLRNLTTAAITFDNNLYTWSEEDTSARIQKKGVSGPAIGISINGSPVPVPGAVWLLASGLIGLVGMKRRFTKG